LEICSYVVLSSSLVSVCGEDAVVKDIACLKNVSCQDLAWCCVMNRLMWCLRTSFQF